MSEHLYQVGDVLDFTNAHVVLPAAAASCEVLRQLSTDGDDPQYRVKCSTETFERVVRESQLRKVRRKRARA